jgi:hypothetical protein
VYMNLFCTSMADYNYKMQPDLWGGAAGLQEIS